MKICGIICEYNPFHNGHAYLLSEAKKLTKADVLICVMSGGFTQRGDLAVMDKFTRAKHAVLAGADAVIELPVPFAISNAEIFAKGAVKLLSSIPDFSFLAFGSENPDKDLFQKAAALTEKESPNIRSIIKAKLKSGMSLTRARREAYHNSDNPEETNLFLSPNNILGLEYTKALRFFNSSAEIFPILRTGSAHNETKLSGRFSSSSAIREAVRQKQLRAVKKNVPSFVFSDLKKTASSDLYKKTAAYAALSLSAEELKKITDCTEGLENRIKALAKSNYDYDLLISKITTKRYTSSRIRRILAAAVLGITDDLTQKCLKYDLYLKILAIKQDKTEELLSTLSKSTFPLILRASDEKKISSKALAVFKKDVFANDAYNFFTDNKTNEHGVLFI